MSLLLLTSAGPAAACERPLDEALYQWQAAGKTLMASYGREAVDHAVKRLGSAGVAVGERELTEIVITALPGKPDMAVHFIAGACLVGEASISRAAFEHHLRIEMG